MYRSLRYIRQHKMKSVVILLMLIAYYFCLPQQLFKDPTATVLTSRTNELLGARIADDGQWRFPSNDSIPVKFKICILLFEDEYFYKHPGFNPISILKALKQNLGSGAVKRGANVLMNLQMRRVQFTSQMWVIGAKLKTKVLKINLIHGYLVMLSIWLNLSIKCLTAKSLWNY